MRRLALLLVSALTFALAGCVPEGSTTAQRPTKPTQPPVTTVAPTTTTAAPVTTTTTRPPATSPRYFADSSPWNTPLPASTTYHDKSALHSSQWWINFEAYSNPVYVASDSDDLVAVHVPATWGWPAGTLTVRVPQAAAPAAGTDGAVTIINGTTAYDFWMFHWDNAAHTGATVSAYAMADINGSGFGTSNPFKGAGIRAAGSSQFGGEVMGSELRTGINHALAVAGLPGMFCAEAGPNGFIAPAISGDSACEGPRVAIPHGVAMPPGLSLQGQNVWKALQTYGGIAVDTVGGGAPVIINADPVSVPASDVAPLYNDLAIITPYARMVN